MHFREAKVQNFPGYSPPVTLDPILARDQLRTASDEPVHFRGFELAISTFVLSILKVPISLFLSSRLKVLSFMNSEFEKPKKIYASTYAFLSKKVRNLSFNRATGDWYL